MASKISQSRKRRRPPSLSTLAKLWRQAILMKSNNTCYLCGTRRAPELLEAHHVIHRSRSGLLKWDPRNGVAVCKGECHQKAHRAWGADIIAKKLGDTYNNIIAIDRQTLKDHLASTGKSRAEWLWEQYETLRQHSNTDHDNR